MKRYFQSSVSALAMSALVIGGIVATVSIAAAPAFSQGNSGNSNARSNDRSSNNNRGGRDNNNRGSAASSLGALNAMHVNEAASTNTAATGLIGLYKSAVVASAEAAASLEDAQAAYDAFLAAQEEAKFATEYGGYGAYQSALTPSEEDIYHWENLNILQEAIDLTAGEAKTAKALEEEALKLAANNDSSEEVIAALWDLLDI